jgi:hypothetical protein
MDFINNHDTWQSLYGCVNRRTNPIVLLSLVRFPYSTWFDKFSPLKKKINKIMNWDFLVFVYFMLNLKDLIQNK